MIIPTGRVVATDSVIVATSGYVVPAAYDISPGSGEARVQQRKRRIQRRVHQKQKDQEDEVFGRILSAKKMKTIEELTTAGYRVTTAGSRLLLLVRKLMLLKVFLLFHLNCNLEQYELFSSSSSNYCLSSTNSSLGSTNFEVFNSQQSISLRLEEDYHSMKDDILLVSVYIMGNMQVQGMLIPDAFLTEEIRTTDDYKEYETVFVNVGKKRKQSARETSSPRESHKITLRKKKQNTTLIPSPCDDRERDEMDEVTLLSLTLHKIALAAKAQENIARVQEKLDEEEIEKMVEIEEDDESYVSEFADSMLNDDDADFGTRIEPGSHKKNPKVVDVDDKDDKKDEDDKKVNDSAGKKDNDDQTNHSLVETHATGSMETRNEQMQTPTPTPTRSPKNDLSLDKTTLEELTTPVSPTTATTSKTKIKRGFTSNKTKILLGSIVGMCRRRGQICTHIKTKFITHEFFMGKIREVLDH
ncbi:hypothetical protein Tco_0051885 [Tanacetum coccineum]